MEPTEQTDFVALFGEWNTTNLGDQAIGRHAVQYFIGIGFNVKLFALGSMVYLGEITHVKQSDEVFQQLHRTARLRQIQKVDRKPTSKTKLRALKKGLPYFEHSLRLIRNWLRWRVLRPQLLQCRIIIVGGGDLLNQQYRNFLTPLYFITSFSRNTSLPLVCLGCSSSSSFSGLAERIVRDFVRQAQIVSVRDHATRKALEGLVSRPITLFGDFALDFSALKKLNKKGNSHAIAINIMMPEAEQKKRYESFLRALIAHLLETKHYAITLFTTGNQEDKLLMQRIYRGFQERVNFFHPDGLKQLENFLEEIDLAVASRLHAAILAMNHHVPTVAISVSSKISSFFETIGLSEYCYSMSPEGQRELLACIDFRQHRSFPVSQILNEIMLERRKVPDALTSLLRIQNAN